MNEKLLEETITKAQETISQSKDWNKTYDEQLKVLTEKKELLDQFHKTIKEFDGIQFYLVGVNQAQDNIFTIQARKDGQPIATINIGEDKTTVTTTTYDESNKKTYNCEFQLKDQDLKTKETMQFLTFFNKDMKPKGKINEQTHTQAMLLSEFAKTSSYDKLLTGIQPIKYSNLYFPIPIILDTKEEEHGYIELLTRTKVRKLTIIEPLTEDLTPEIVLANGTSKAIFLLNLLHSEQGQQWYKVLGFHGRCTEHLTIKVCIAVPKELKSKCKEFEPYELRADKDSIEYHYMTYDTDGAKITKIDTTLNN